MWNTIINGLRIALVDRGFTVTVYSAVVGAPLTELSIECDNGTKVIRVYENELTMWVESDNPKYRSYRLCHFNPSMTQPAMVERIERCLAAPYPYGPKAVAEYRQWAANNPDLDCYKPEHA